MTQTVPLTCNNTITSDWRILNTQFSSTSKDNKLKYSKLWMCPISYHRKWPCHTCSEIYPHMRSCARLKCFRMVVIRCPRRSGVPNNKIQRLLNKRKPMKIHWSRNQINKRFVEPRYVVKHCPLNPLKSNKILTTWISFLTNIWMRHHPQYQASFMRRRTLHFRALCLVKSSLIQFWWRLHTSRNCLKIKIYSSLYTIFSLLISRKSRFLHLFKITCNRLRIWTCRRRISSRNMFMWTRHIVFQSAACN